MGRSVVCLIGLLVVVAACGSKPPAADPVASTTVSRSPSTTVAPSTATLPPSTTALPSTAATTAATVPAARHVDHDGLAALLPSAAELGWLPADVTESADSDLTSVLVLPECTGPFTTVPANREATTNRGYIAGQEPLLTITYYDADTVADATTFMAEARRFVDCAPPVPNVTSEIVELDSPIGCDDLLVVRTHQPVGQTVDIFCTVANLVASIRLYPTGLLATVVEDSAPAPTPPTDEQAAATVAVVATRLHAAG